jgi:hypothetical protein
LHRPACGAAATRGSPACGSGRSSGSPTRPLGHVPSCQARPAGSRKASSDVPARVAFPAEDDRNTTGQGLLGLLARHLSGLTCPVTWSPGHLLGHLPGHLRKSSSEADGHLVTCRSAGGVGLPRFRLLTRKTPYPREGWSMLWTSPRAVAPGPRPRPWTGRSQLEHIGEFGAARVHGVGRRPAVESKQAHQFLRPVGCAQDAGGDDLLTTRALPGLLSAGRRRAARRSRAGGALSRSRRRRQPAQSRSRGGLYSTRRWSGRSRFRAAGCGRVDARWD